jgi:hypothetical protein
MGKRWFDFRYLQRCLVSPQVLQACFEAQPKEQSVVLLSSE